MDPPVDCGIWGVATGALTSKPNRSSAADRGCVTGAFSNAGAVGCEGAMCCLRLLGGTNAGGNDCGITPRPSFVPLCWRIRNIATANSSRSSWPAELMSDKSQICARVSSGSLALPKNSTA